MRMTATMAMLLTLLAVLAGVAVAAKRMQTAPSILMVIAGLGLAVVPGLPSLELAPELVLFGILPPLIYAAGVSMSWREFRFNLRPIILFAFGGVIFTACAIALAAHWLFGMPFAAAFILGAIIAPPDTVAPLAIARPLGLPRRLLVILEGEGLANDATALILYRFTVAAASTGLFSLPAAAGTFILIAAGEIGYGIIVGWASLRVRHWVRHSVGHDPICRVLDTGAAWGIWRARNDGSRTIRELERSAAHSGSHQAPGRLLLGPGRLSLGGVHFSHHGITGPHHSLSS
jgi:CPA1 family monovalent cation:H+ antiporter